MGQAGTPSTARDDGSSRLAWSRNKDEQKSTGRGDVAATAAVGSLGEEALARQSSSRPISVFRTYDPRGSRGSSLLPPMFSTGTMGHPKNV
jgi:hypothetical protein